SSPPGPAPCREPSFSYPGPPEMLPSVSAGAGAVGAGLVGAGFVGAELVSAGDVAEGLVSAGCVPAGTVVSASEDGAVLSASDVPSVSSPLPLMPAASFPCVIPPSADDAASTCSVSE